jgi:GTP-binding protein
VLEYEGRKLTLIDTAGIRRRGHIEPGVERHSVMRAAEAVERSDVALVTIDAADLATAQDAHVVQIADEAYKGLVLVVSKVDLLHGAAYRHDLTSELRRRLRFVPWAPIVFTSAKEGSGLDELLRAALQAAEQRDLRVATGPLNNLLQRAMVEHPPRSVQGRRLKLLYATQAGVRPPTFVLFVNDARLLHFSYRRYLENRLRQAYGFVGTAIRFNFKSRGETATTESVLRGNADAAEPSGGRGRRDGGTGRRQRTARGPRG